MRLRAAGALPESRRLKDSERYSRGRSQTPSGVKWSFHRDPPSVGLFGDSQSTEGCSPYHFFMGARHEGDSEGSAHALGVRVRWVRRRATNEGWPFEEIAIRGGRQRLYPVATLPHEIHAALLRAQASVTAAVSSATAPSVALPPPSLASSLPVRDFPLRVSPQGFLLNRASCGRGSSASTAKQKARARGRASPRSTPRSP